MFYSFNYAEFIFFCLRVWTLYIFEAYVWCICLCIEYLRMYGICVCVFIYIQFIFNTLYYVQCIHLFIFDLCVVFHIWYIYLCPFYLCVMFYLWFICLCSVLISGCQISSEDVT
jgi:hypothetical protein